MQQIEKAGMVARKGSGAKGGTHAVSLRGGDESFSELAHDARNMVTALALYCELLEEPGVLMKGAGHFVQELRMVTAASWRLLEKLARMEQRGPGNFAGTRTWRSSPLVEALPGTRPAGARNMFDLGLAFQEEVESLRGELEANRNLLSALAGPGVAVRVQSADSACRVALKGEDVTRLLVNLVRNATEAMHGSGSIRIVLAECGGEKGAMPRVRLIVEDSGPGIPAADLDRVFDKGFTTCTAPARNGVKSHELSGRRGLGLSIVRNLVERAGGRITAGNCVEGGARIAIELPVRMH